jgi:type I restriction enzyme S subunit
MSFPQYQNYKYSGFDWLGKIPDEWSLGKFRHLFSESSEKIESGMYGEMLSVSGYRGVEVKEYADENQKRTEENLIGYRIVHQGQLVVNTMWLNYAGLGISQLEGHVSPAYRSYWINDGLHKLFVHYLMRSSLYVLGYTKYLTGVRPNSLQMGRDDLMSFPIVIPSLTEQKVIASFLDHEVAKIDKLVAEQGKLIELLKEKRQAVISNAVTKGLNPNVKMKNSGVVWLGDIPDHWGVRAIKHIVSTPVTDGPHETPEFFDDGVPFVSAEAVSSGEIDFSKIRGYISQESHKKYSLKYLPKKGDIFMIKSGATTGVTAIVETDQEFNIWSPLAVIRCNAESNPYYVLNFMRSLNFQEAVALNWNFGTQQNIGMRVIENLFCPVPSQQEQKAIAEYLTSFTKQFNTLIFEANNAIELLKERRSALISAAVTGQIDVRNFQFKEAA